MFLVYSFIELFGVCYYYYYINENIVFGLVCSVNNFEEFFGLVGFMFI